MSKLSEQLKELMAEDNLTQSALAKAMDTPSAKFSLYLSGKSTPDYKFFVALSEFFNCSADFLAGLTEYPKRDINYKPCQPFAVRIRNVLQEKAFSQYTFIKESGISWSIFHNWLKGKSLPSVDNLIKLAKFFDCSIDYLLGRED